MSQVISNMVEFRHAYRTIPLPTLVWKTRSSMVSRSCRAPSKMLRHLLRASPRWMLLPIYAIYLNHGAALGLFLQTTATSCPSDVQGWPSMSFLGWTLLFRQVRRSPLGLLGCLHHNLPPPSSHLSLSHMLSMLLHIESPLMMSHFQG
jgi:hypothetical protein